MGLTVDGQGAKSRPLTPKQATFVAEYLKTGNGAQSAIAAGYSRKNARQSAHYLLHHVQAVMEAVSAIRQSVAEKAEYDVEAAMGEALAAMDFAQRTDNANAYVKAVELRAKLMGLLVERIDQRTVTVDLVAAVNEARCRLDLNQTAN